MNRLVIALALLTVISANDAQGGACITTASDFDRWHVRYKLDRSSQEAMTLGAFVVGIVETLTLLDMLCVPDDVHVDDLQTLATRHFDDKMKGADALPSQTCAAAVIIAIMSERFPCSAATPEAATPAK